MKIQCNKTSVKRTMCERLKSLPVGCYVTVKDFPDLSPENVSVVFHQLKAAGYFKVRGYQVVGKSRMAHYELLQPIVLAEPEEEPKPAPIVHTPLPEELSGMGSWAGLFIVGAI